jgi:hypothetical protein
MQWQWRSNNIEILIECRYWGREVVASGKVKGRVSSSIYKYATLGNCKAFWKTARAVNINTNLGLLALPTYRVVDVEI